MVSLARHTSHLSHSPQLHSGHGGDDFMQSGTIFCISSRAFSPLYFALIVKYAATGPSASSGHTLASGHSSTNSRQKPSRTFEGWHLVWPLSEGQSSLELSTGSGSEGISA